MAGHLYKLRYNLTVEAGRFTKEELKPKGGTDALIVISCISPADGSYSQNFWSHDGARGGNTMPANDLFKAWLMMGAALSQDREGGELDKFQTELAKLPSDLFFQKIREGRAHAAKNRN